MVGYGLNAEIGKKFIDYLYGKEKLMGVTKNRTLNKIGLEKYNNQGYLMKIIQYEKFDNMLIEFQDDHKATIKTCWSNFSKGNIRNPYAPTVCGVGITGNKYPTSICGKTIKEYMTWRDMLRRCYRKQTKEKQPTYKDVTCCEEWLWYENFYEWLHSQENFDKWLNGEKWTLDKDIICKGNKMYCPEKCCLVHNNINVLFTKDNAKRGMLPIGVIKNPRQDNFIARCANGENKNIYLGTFYNAQEAFYAYKEAKEKIIKETAKEEYKKGNIVKKCYEAMMCYEVEITD